jgi:predicted CXXCH cytochrome family protein
MAPAPNNRRRILWVLVGALIVSAVVASWHAERRVEHEAAFCTGSCHHDGASSKHPGALTHVGNWAASGHADVECQACHTVPVGTGLALLWGSLRGASHVAPHGAVSPSTCTKCHEKHPGDWRPIDATAGHRAHRGAPRVDCLSCHGESTHATVAPEKVCTSCHKDETLHKPTTLGAETCLSCHSFAVSQKNMQPPTTVTCTKCHADRSALLASAGGGDVRPMKDVNEHVLHGGVACQLCHNAHGKKLEPPPGEPVCATCHRVETTQAKALSGKGPDEHRLCVGCHKEHTPRATALQTCVNCHAAQAKGLTSEGPEKTTALKHESCASCHTPHTWHAERSGCLSCHKKEANLVATQSPEQHAECTTCHDIHGPPPTGAVCLKCHEKAGDTPLRDHVALAPERHKDCTSCHDPHAPRPEETRASCAKCHTAEETQVSAGGPAGHAKATCLGCHQPHLSPLAPRGVCASCHAAKAMAVATAGPPKHRLCTSCHEKHEFRVTDIQATCSKCHDKQMFQTTAGVAKDFSHRGDCKSCHTVHGPPGVAKAACLDCHKQVAKEFNPPNPQHALCRSCHAPHTPAATAPALCTTCHAKESAVAAKWPASSAHAQACNGCHQPHDVRVKKACAECHAPEAASATGSKHQCVQCHAPHQDPPGTGRAWWSRCSQCHADKAQSVKDRGPVHSDCKSCHQEHRFAVPKCTTCHTDIRTKGLHAVDKHAAICTSCHDAHAHTDPKPQQCLSCHTDRRNHEPDAKRCQTCHLFK